MRISVCIIFSQKYYSIKFLTSEKLSGEVCAKGTMMGEILSRGNMSTEPGIHAVV
jgi:hypothetical protein